FKARDAAAFTKLAGDGAKEGRGTLTLLASFGLFDPSHLDQIAARGTVVPEARSGGAPASAAGGVAGGPQGVATHRARRRGARPAAGAGGGAATARPAHLALRVDPSRRPGRAPATLPNSAPSNPRVRGALGRCAAGREPEPRRYCAAEGHARIDRQGAGRV